MAETRTIEVKTRYTYTHYEIGDIICSTSSRSVLERDKLYTVTRFIAPNFWVEGYMANSTIFVGGREYGFSGEYNRPATQEEVEAGRPKEWY